MNIVPCFGVHPWLEHQLDMDNDELEDSLERHLQAFPNAIVGEIGLDGHRYSPDTGDLATPMEQQVFIFESQMKIAARLNRPVSIHAVHCWGPLMASLSKLKKHKLPPSLYFHAFGGKVGTVDQLLALCRGKHTYFGFAPCINFRSPKTADVIRKVGLKSLVLETDRENAALVQEDMIVGIDMIAKALDLSKEEVIQQTTANSRELYRL